MVLMLRRRCCCVAVVGGALVCFCVCVAQVTRIPDSFFATLNFDFILTKYSTLGTPWSIP